MIDCNFRSALYSKGFWSGVGAGETHPIFFFSQALLAPQFLSRKFSPNEIGDHFVRHQPLAKTSGMGKHAPMNFAVKSVQKKLVRFDYNGKFRSSLSIVGEFHLPLLSTV
ncbi:MAG: hypothetical protein NZ937_00950 [Armatimonadetes bacterium]|nr:hypothetical protein [Armatimonadota bacterium]